MPNDQQDDLRASLTAAFDKAESSTTDTEPVEAVEAAPAEVAEVEVPEAEAAETDEAATAEAKGERNEKGQFVPKGKTPPAKAQTAPTPGAAQVDPNKAATQEKPAVVAPVAKAPQSWTPSAREEWAKLSPAVQKEVLRREHQVQQALSESAPDRKLAQEFKAAYQPYEAMIRAEGGNPIAAVQSLLQTAAAFRTAPPAHKAQLWMGLAEQFGVPVDEASVANLIRQRNLSVDRLAQALDGKAAPQSAPQQPQAVDPNVVVQRAIQQFEAKQRQQAEQAHVQRAAGEFEQFIADPSNEFAPDVRETMADLIELAAKRGKALTYAEAYQRALLDPEHSDIQAALKQREQARQATAPGQVAATRRAKVASSSVRSQPAGSAGVTKPEPESLREHLDAAAAQHGWR